MSAPPLVRVSSENKRDPYLEQAQGEDSQRNIIKNKKQGLRPVEEQNHTGPPVLCLPGGPSQANLVPVAGPSTPQHPPLLNNRATEEDNFTATTKIRKVVLGFSLCTPCSSPATKSNSTHLGLGHLP